MRVQHQPQQRGARASRPDDEEGDRGSVHLRQASYLVETCAFSSGLMWADQNLSSAIVTNSRRELKRSRRTDDDPSMRLRSIRAAHDARRLKNVPGLLTGGDLAAPVFIIGAPRSGTSLLYAILRKASALKHWPGESHEIWEADYHPSLRGWGSNALS